MSDTNNPGDKTAERGPRKPLSLKRPIEQGVVRQSFSHGRTKQVMVETVKRRVGAPAAPPAREAAPAARPAPQSARRQEKQQSKSWVFWLVGLIVLVNFILPVLFAIFESIFG